MSALVIGREKMFVFLGPNCKGTWFKVVPDQTEDTRYKAVIVSIRGGNAEAHKNFLRDQMRGDRNNVEQLDRWIEFLIKQEWAAVWTVGVQGRFGGAVVFHKPSGEIEVIPQPYCIGRLGDEFDAYVVQRAFNNKFQSMADNPKMDDNDIARFLLDQLEDVGALKGCVYEHEYN